MWSSRADDEKGRLLAAWSDYLLHRGGTVRSVVAYTRTLNRPMEVAWVPVPRRRRRLPVVLSGTEVSRLLDAVKSPKYRAVIGAS